MKAAKNTEWIVQFETQMLVSAFLAKALYQEPDVAWLHAIAEEKLFDALPPYAENRDVEDALALLRSGSASLLGEHRDGAVEAICRDYMHLFVGPGRLLAAPWGSVYSNKDRAVFQTETVGVKNWYKRFSLGLATEYNEPADHVGLEFSFLSHLSKLTIAASKQFDGEEVKRLIAAQRGFLTQHMLRWIPSWADAVEAHAQTEWFLGLASLSRAVLTEAKSFLAIALVEHRDTGPFRRTSTADA
ncbi:TorA maturation chaperone TorD [Sphingobium xenophagum]|uniref:TorA maturation chaperone TorD n=1 Tax=Sphingobium xenophagum TaxID=121428 RepID=A0ABU1X386_SPHXE|nr:molecular chaperone TorD family protein [Sphingobium xenophagum]MDR7155724.1 TorA maturation chaperone TorD [Sphingobium xenophagum]